MNQLPEWLVDDSVGPGWVPLVQQLHEELLAVNPDYQVAQVKEKFGELRVYLSMDNRQLPLMQAVGVATAKSVTICEWCGEPGTCGEASAFWIKTLCDQHRAEWQAGRRWWDNAAPTTPDIG